jgi:hypothetical protein
MDLPVDSYVPRDRLATSRDKARAFLGRHGRSGRDFVRAELTAQGALELVSRASGEATGTPVLAEVNHGRWIAHCECGGAEVVDPDDPVFFCLSCLNADNGRGLRPVEFPSEKERLQIAEVLLHRKERRSRGWLPTETVGDLKRQNRERGDRE